MDVKQIELMTRDEVVYAIRELRSEVGVESLDRRVVLQRRLQDMDWLAASRPSGGPVAAEAPPSQAAIIPQGHDGRSRFIGVRVPTWLFDKMEARGKAEGKNRSQVVVAALALLLDK